MNKPVKKFRILLVRQKCLALYVNKEKVLMLAAKLKVAIKALRWGDMVSGCDVI
jgi:hypothetical protein